MSNEPFRPAQAIVAPLPADPNAWKLEIDELLADPGQTNLFLLALRRMQDEPVLEYNKDNWLSYYNLAAIHGDPLERWNNVEPINTKDFNDQNNPPYWYCTHGSDVFPTFHRAYLMAFENALSAKAYQIANEYNEPHKTFYLNAARRLRLPFWDPFMPRKTQSGPIESVWGLPEILKTKEVYVRLPPNNEPAAKPISNPLYSFKLPDAAAVAAKGRSPLDVQAMFNTKLPDLAKRETLRAPGSTGEMDAALLERAIQLQAKMASSKVWQLLRPDATNQQRTWRRFSNHSRLSNPNEDRMGASVESWHDDIHNLVGSAIASVRVQQTGSSYPGAMSHPGVAAFDPIFWLHHNNCDRYVAIYQALFTDKFITTEAVKYPNTNDQTWLRPFTNAKGKPCTSVDMKDFKQVRFAVPGAKDLDAQGRAELERYLQTTYYWATEGGKPPANWPKDLSQCFALRGKTVGPAPILKFDAIEKTTEGNLQLVRRRIAVSIPNAEPAVAVEDMTPKTAVVNDNTDDKTIHPAGSLHEGSQPEKTQMRVWNAYVNVRKHAFNGSFNIHLFVGEPSSASPLGFILAGNELGFSGVFTSEKGAACDRCRVDGEAIYEDVVPLTSALTAYLKTSNAPGPTEGMRLLDDLEPAHVEQFLTEHLNWSVVDVAGNLKTPQQLQDAGLEISVWDRIFDAPTAENPLGHYGPPTLHVAITQGKPGGFNGT